MPECELCGETHATVNEAEWVNQSVMACPECWADFEGSNREEVEFELDPEVNQLLSQEGVNADKIVNGLLELERARQMVEQ